MEKQPNPIPDIFITKKEQDTLGRKELVKLIVKAILAKRRENLHKALSVGIYGEWGEGKTSLMKMVETELNKIIKKDKKKNSSEETEEHEDAETEEHEDEDTKEYEEEDQDNINKGKLETIWYDPWSYNEFEKIFWDFFEKLSSLSLGDEELSTAIISYGKELVHKESSSSPVTSSYMAQLKLSLPSEGDDINDLKDLISKKLVEKRIHVVVFVDDIDRLLPNEIQFIFKLTRQIADFDNVIYIMGFDPNVVSHVLKKGYGSLHFGKSYMEKMIQVPIVLPVIQEPRLKNYLAEKLTGLVALNALNVSNYRISGIVDKLSFAFKTKRSIIRYINQINFVCPLLNKVTNFEDLCLIELLKFLDEQAWMKIYQKRNILLKISKIANDEALDMAKDTEIESISNSFQGKYISFVRNILKNYLFPNKKETYRSKTINHPFYFHQYFIYANPDVHISDELVRELKEITNKIKTINSGTLYPIKSIKGWINERVDTYSVYEIEHTLFYTLDNILLENDRKKVEKVAYTICLALAKSKLSEGYQYFSSDNPNSLDETIGVYIIQDYLGHIIDTKSNKLIVDEEKFNNLLKFIFFRAPINFCMNLNKTIYENIKDIFMTWETFRILTLRIKYEDFFLYSYDIQLAFLNVWKKTSSNLYKYKMRQLLRTKDFKPGYILKKWLTSIPEKLRSQKKKEIVDLFVSLKNEFISNPEIKSLKNDVVIKDFINSLISASKTSKAIDPQTGKYVNLTIRI